MRKWIVGIVGGRNCSKEVEKLAQELGKNLAKVADFLVCGGLGGVMKAVCKGFKSKGGVTIGIIPGYDKNDANPYVDIVIPSGLGLARNVLVVKTADVVVALPGEYGTLSEIAYCLQFGIPVISFRSWDIKGVIKVNSLEELIIKIKQILKGGNFESNSGVRRRQLLLWRGKK
ncbi:MAG: TIGR00725 family protein [Candidatus Omnitrophica bacterium]|nr:TIGR00725 family protein [Candidatus Omnitrophota bacterium]MCM8799132.1 TIGR00725 family protein [Candidatus Omnitrophota bacterium]